MSRESAIAAAIASWSLRGHSSSRSPETIRVGAMILLSSVPWAASDEPVAHETLILDHDLALFAEAKPAQGCDPSPARGEQCGNGVNAEFYEGVC